MEIERKWLLAAVPQGRPDEQATVEQFYVSLHPEVRLRAYVTNCENHIPFRMAIKGEGTLSREEIQTPVTEEFYRDTLRFIAKPAIKKDFVCHHRDGYEVCTSIVDDGAFIYSEVEFESEEEAKNYQFPWPELVIREVTYDSNYKMKNYWERTRC